MSDAAHASAACLNCDHPLAPPGCFCPQCGQAPAHRLSTAHVLHEVLHVFTHADKGIFAYLPLVLLRPGRLVADYLAGRRKRHFNPFQFLLLAVGLVTLLGVKLHYYDAIGTGVEEQMRQRGASAAQLTRTGAYFHFIGAFFNIWWLALLPLQALMTWAVYARRGLNYAESVLVQVVLGGAFQLYLLGLLPALVWGQFPGRAGFVTGVFQFLMVTVYLALIGRQGLGLSWAGAWWRALVCGLLSGAISVALNYLAFNLYVNQG